MSQDILNNLTDEKLIEEVIKGNKTSFEILYHRYKNKIYTYILHILNFNTQETDTIITETFLKVYTYIKNKSPEISNFKSFIYRTAHNLSINFIQKETNQKFIETSKFEYIKDDAYQELKTNVNNQFKQEIIQNLIQRLEPKYREIIYLYYFEQYNYDQIANIIKSNRNSVGTLLLKAKLNLKTLINKYGYQDIL